ncbi:MULTISPECIES: ECF-type riboflavin transporter substrate-binding protein [unclassified Sporolactobacillus]|uniref:ECF-type riboflavin transporter substrate-binding protein n=1 Tax=unclassified Sporolactobacillus TaxID=2628533 RepID=UPI0023674525|nr:ECF-type riboflavin transporter substrate-binding protein [Sporolactobacillus sp. CQH2019]MDD9147960.1 ECF-type riboflavin transporter substrate-binding protein [Sporolactobacillus sp. CQH2019]
MVKAKSSKELLSIRTIVAIGIGAAIFIILRYISIPAGIVPNTTIQLSYIFLALIAVIYGPVAGGLIGLIGHSLGDALQYGSVWWSWVIVSTLVGVGFGLISSRLKITEGIFDWKSVVIFNATQVMTQAVGWFLIAPVLDIVIYSEPANKVFLQGFVAGILDIVTVGIFGTLLIWIYAKTQTKKGSLKKEA